MAISQDAINALVAQLVKEGKEDALQELLRGITVSAAQARAEQAISALTPEERNRLVTLKDELQQAIADAEAKVREIRRERDQRITEIRQHAKDAIAEWEAKRKEALDELEQVRERLGEADRIKEQAERQAEAMASALLEGKATGGGRRSNGTRTSTGGHYWRKLAVIYMNEDGEVIEKVYSVGSAKHPPSRVWSDIPSSLFGKPIGVRKGTELIEQAGGFPKGEGDDIRTIELDNATFVLSDWGEY